MTEDMTAPVTRGELKEELTTFRTEMRADFSTFRSEMRDEFAAFRKELGTFVGSEIARHFKVAVESMRQQFGVLDDKQNDQNDQHVSLARRVDRLEVAVFDPPNPKP
jgi:hypothetical protein